MGQPSKELQKLIQVYTRSKIDYPVLKPITLAQWILESGWGSSDLACQYNNFAGIKWREVMKPYASKISYKAHDGIDVYCHFDNIENFIRGYWTFLDRPPYKGWKNHVSNGEDFIRFIGLVWAEDTGYIEKVLGLQDKAKLLLIANQNDYREIAELGSQDYIWSKEKKHMKVITITAGHSNTDPGAVAFGQKEALIMTNFRNIVTYYLSKYDNITIRTDGVGSNNLPLKQAISLIKGSDIAVEFHLNAASTPKAKGVEAFSLPQHKDICQKLCKVVSEILGIPVRGSQQGWKDQSESQRGSLGFVRNGGIILELFFITNGLELQRYNEVHWLLARGIADILVDYVE